MYISISVYHITIIIFVQDHTSVPTFCSCSDNDLETLVPRILSFTTDQLLLMFLLAVNHETLSDGLAINVSSAGT